MYDYLWRWDTDWFWCSRAFGRPAPGVRRLWPRRWRRSDVYHRLIALDRPHRHRRPARPAGGPPAARAGGPGRRGAGRAARRSSSTGSTPRSGCGRCGCARVRRPRRAWPTYPLEPGRTYVNVGFWGTVHVGPDAADAPLNRAIEAKVHELGGHKSLYSEAFYDRDDLRPLYDGANLAARQAPLRPRRPVHRPSTTRRCADDDLTRPARPSRSPRRCRSLLRDGAAAAVHGVRRQRGRPGGLAVPACTCATERGLAYLLTAPGDLGFARAYVAGDLELDGVHPGDPYDAARAAA